MKVAITGAGGLIGTALTAALRARGDETIALTRGEAGPGRVAWDPTKETIDLPRLSAVDAVVHLAGENVFGRWTDAKRARIHDSRVDGTRTLATRLPELVHAPRALVCASAIGFYGERGDETLTEESAKGEGFLADVVADWEAAAQPARDAGLRVSNLRFGVVLSGRGGAFTTALPAFRFGVAGRFGSGRQWFSWIQIDDLVRAVLLALDDAQIEGAYNVTSPNPVTNAQYTKAIGRAVHRPTLFPVPAPVLKAVLGEFSSELLGSARVVPKRLQEAGFRFAYPGIDAAVHRSLDQRRAD